ncbi:MAG: 5-methylcytosine-specific restriction endonuclease system specificity protein McrC [Prevotella sp.]|nr:5-methylcytosine-specific restriction endonuclease system specificity protein McrC [Prevotella sp.]
MTQNKHILIKNIYYMLAYAFRALRPDNADSIAAEQFDNIHNLFAAILSEGIGQQIKQGLYRKYLERREDIPRVRGRIDIAGTMRNKAARRQLVSCEYDELSVNNLLNQILKTTVFLLLRYDDVNAKYKDLLKKEMAFFAEIDTVNPRLIPWSDLRFHRNNRTYRLLIGLCQLVIESMLLTTEKGERRLKSFVDDQLMPRLYEKFILEYYRKEFPEIKAEAAQIEWKLDDDNRAWLPVMQSDVTLTYGGRTLIIDAKYYSRVLAQGQYGADKIASHNLYQIFTYVKNRAAAFDGISHSVSGMLLYARTDETTQPDVTYKMSGNRIAVKTLNLNCDFSVIKDQLNSIITEYLAINRPAGFALLPS